jgi:hypothetical protein
MGKMRGEGERRKGRWERGVERHRKSGKEERKARCPYTHTPSPRVCLGEAAGMGK